MLTTKNTKEKIHEGHKGLLYNPLVFLVKSLLSVLGGESLESFAIESLGYRKEKLLTTKPT